MDSKFEKLIFVTGFCDNFMIRRMISVAIFKLCLVF